MFSLKESVTQEDNHIKGLSEKLMDTVFIFSIVQLYETICHKYLDKNINKMDHIAFS